MVKTVHEDDPDIDTDLSEQEGELRTFLGENAEQLDVFHAGLAMEEFSGSPAGSSLIKRANDDLQEAFNIFLTADDLNTEEVKKAHFDARVALEIVNRVKDAILQGKEAGDSIQESQAGT